MYINGNEDSSTNANKEKNVTMLKISEKSKEMGDQFLRSKCQMERVQSALLDADNPKQMAALKLKKVYRSFSTRRKLADCAILIEQSWWKLLDFAELKRCSISFYDIEKHETTISRWSRARTRAAKVGKGLSKDVKARKLSLQHWLEAVDPRHRYGHNLHFYYDKWLKSQSREPFFYWLDMGEGKEINLGKCPRSKLQQQCIKYLGPMERLPYEVVVVDGRLFYKQSGEPIHTTGEGADAKWIFVLSTSKTLYVGKKKKGSFQHSSFLAGGATSCAGTLVVEHGVLKAVWPHSGHYHPTEENFKEFISFLEENNVDISNVKKTPIDDDDDLCSLRNSGHRRSHSSEEDLAGNMSGMEDEETSVEDSIFEKIISHKEMKSYQLGKQLSCKWTSGVGPRVGCVRDYPCELQFHALEQVNLSPRNGCHSESSFSPRTTTGHGLS